MRTFIRKKQHQSFGASGIIQVEYHGDVPFFIGGPMTGRRYAWHEKGKRPFDQADYNALTKEQRELFGKKKPKPKENKE